MSLPWVMEAVVSGWYLIISGAVFGVLPMELGSRASSSWRLLESRLTNLTSQLEPSGRPSYLDDRENTDLRYDSRFS